MIGCCYNRAIRRAEAEAEVEAEVGVNEGEGDVRAIKREGTNCLGGSLNTPAMRIYEHSSTAWRCISIIAGNPYLHPIHTKNPTTVSMADVRKLLQTERRLRETSNPRFKSSGVRATTKRTYLEVDDATVAKRQKITLDPSTGPPAGFSDGTDEGRTTEGDFGADNGEDDPLSRAEELGTAKVEEDDASMAEASNANTISPTLPSNFFEAKYSIPSAARVEVDEDEWAAFQADVAEPARPVMTSVMVIEAAPMTSNAAAASEEQDTVDDYARGEEEDAKQKLMDEFEEMESLEHRVLRLKERREALKKKALAMTKTEVVEIELDEDHEEDGEEDDDFFRARGS